MATIAQTQAEIQQQQSELQKYQQQIAAARGAYQPFQLTQAQLMRVTPLQQVRFGAAEQERAGGFQKALGEATSQLSAAEQQLQQYQKGLQQWQTTSAGRLQYAQEHNLHAKSIFHDGYLIGYQYKTPFGTVTDYSPSQGLQAMGQFAQASPEYQAQVQQRIEALRGAQQTPIGKPIYTTELVKSFEYPIGQIETRLTGVDTGTQIIPVQNLTSAQLDSIGYMKQTGGERLIKESVIPTEVFKPPIKIPESVIEKQMPLPVEMKMIMPGAVLGREAVSYWKEKGAAETLAGSPPPKLTFPIKEGKWVGFEPGTWITYQEETALGFPGHLAEHFFKKTGLPPEVVITTGGGIGGLGIKIEPKAYHIAEKIAKEEGIKEIEKITGKIPERLIPKEKLLVESTYPKVLTTTLDIGTYVYPGTAPYRWYPWLASQYEQMSLAPWGLKTAELIRTEGLKALKPPILSQPFKTTLGQIKEAWLAGTAKAEPYIKEWEKADLLKGKPTTAGLKAVTELIKAPGLEAYREMAPPSIYAYSKEHPIETAITIIGTIGALREAYKWAEGKVPWLRRPISEEQLSRDIEREPNIRHRATIRLVDKKTGKVLSEVNPNTGFLDAPGGNIKRGEKPINAAYREIEEELGISKKDIELVFRDKVALSDQIHYIYEASINAEDLMSKIKMNPKEVAGVSWMKFSKYSGPTASKPFGEKQGILGKLGLGKIVDTENLYVNSRLDIIDKIESKLVKISSSAKTKLGNTAYKWAAKTYGEEAVKGIAKSALIRDYLLMKEQMLYKALLVPTSVSKDILIAPYSRYDIPFISAKEYTGKELWYVHGAPGKIPTKIPVFGKTFEVEAAALKRGEPFLYFHPSTTPLPTGQPYLGASYLGLFPGKPSYELSQVTFLKKTPTIYMTKTAAGDVLQWTKKAIKGTEFEAGAPVGTMFKIIGKEPSFSLAGRKVDIKIITPLKAGEKIVPGTAKYISESNIAKAMSELTKVYISPYPLLGTSLSLIRRPSKPPSIPSKELVIKEKYAYIGRPSEVIVPYKKEKEYGLVSEPYSFAKEIPKFEYKPLEYKKEVYKYESQPPYKPYGGYEYLLLKPYSPVIPLKEEKEIAKRMKRKLKYEKAYQLMVRRKKKYEAIGIPMAKAAALRKGEFIARGTAIATFKVVPTKEMAPVTAPYTPSPMLFRTYKVVRRKMIPLKDTYIQRRPMRIISPGEIKEISMKGVEVRKGRLSAKGFGIARSKKSKSRRLIW